VAVVDGESLLTPTTNVLDLAVPEAEATIEEGHAAVSGLVENQSEATLAQIVVVAVFYDDQGQVTGYAQVRLDGPLAPGARLPFALDTTPPGGLTTDYRLLVQGVSG
jgi:hypothetical protein